MRVCDGDRLCVGLVCFPTYGGSGIVATELARGLARRGHSVHLVAYEMPVRFERFTEAVFFHEVESIDYPVFPQSPYAIALASKLVELCRYHKLDALHVHYAVPHATSAWLAGQVLGKERPKLITTLHGTDTTLVGGHPSFLPITRFSVEQSDVVTVPSVYLRETTYSSLGVSQTQPIHVIPNFVDTTRYCPADPARRREQRALLAGPGRELPEDVPILMHASNFRALKRVDLAIAMFERLLAQRPAQLVLIGDGPERSRLEASVWQRGLERHVRFLGKQSCIVELLQAADLFVLPSETESFGLAALEAMACGVPVLASHVGGLPEVVADGETGLLAPVGDVDAFAEAALELFCHPSRLAAMGAAARARAELHFGLDLALDRFEALYRANAAPSPTDLPRSGPLK